MSGHNVVCYECQESGLGVVIHKPKCSHNIKRENLTRTCIHPGMTQEKCNCLDIDGTCLVEEFYQGDWECLWETDREAVQDET